MPRALVLVVLLAAYLMAGLRPVAGDLARRGRFDPFLPTARALEHRVEENRFADALPMALELRRAYPDEPEIALQLARIHRGLRDASGEAAAWERYVSLSPAPAEACPALPDAYVRAGRPAEARDAAARCSAFAQRDALPGSSRR